MSEPKLEQVEMCEHYDPLLIYHCHRGLEGSLRCHSRRQDCKFYEPSATGSKPDESRLVTDEEFVDAQMKYMKENNLSFFPLKGEARDDCNRKAQDVKSYPIGFRDGYNKAMNESRIKNGRDNG